VKHQAHAYGREQAVAFEEEPHPNLDEVMQRPESPVAVPVKHDGPIQTHELPSRFGTIGNITASTTPYPILAADRARKRAVLIATDNPFIVLLNNTVVGTNTYALWPINVPLEIRHSDKVWVATTTGNATISYFTENWAD